VTTARSILHTAHKVLYISRVSHMDGGNVLFEHKMYIQTWLIFYKALLKCGHCTCMLHGGGCCCCWYIIMGCQGLTQFVWTSRSMPGKNHFHLSSTGAPRHQGAALVPPGGATRDERQRQARHTYVCNIVIII